MVTLCANLVCYLLLLLCVHLCLGNVRRRERVGFQHYAKSPSKRFVFDADHKFTGWASWEQYAACSTLCVSGYEDQTKKCCDTGDNRACFSIPWDQLKSHIGSCKATTTTTTTPVDGHWSSYGPWSDCTATCGGGTHTRDRNCTYPDHTLHGKYCPGSNSETRACNERHCPVDGSWSKWSVYGRCSASCGNGTHFRTRSCDFDPRYDHGANCSGTSQETGRCWAGECPVDGVWADWGVWHSCTVSCGGGTQERTRICFFKAGSPHGANCNGDTHESKACGAQFCPVDGSWSKWSVYGRCSVSCGNGTHFRTRSCAFDPRYGHGANCTGTSQETGTCLAGQCPVDGVWADWGVWHTCTVSCGGGTQERTRVCSFKAGSPHGANCIGDTRESQTCGTQFCPVDGHITNWTAWTSCPVTCGGGAQTRSRTCEFPPDRPRGNNCAGELDQVKACADNLCPAGVITTRTTTTTTTTPKQVPAFDGYWAAWSSWSACTKSCGKGLKFRARTCHYDDTKPRGKACSGDRIERLACNEGQCSVDGVWSNWVSWSQCTHTCNGGKQSHERVCVYKLGFTHGAACSGDTREYQDCGMQPCPVDGYWSDWSSWSVCTKTCGGQGLKFRARICQYDDTNPRGKPCSGDGFDRLACNEGQCSVATWSEWNHHSECSQSCGASGFLEERRDCSTGKVQDCEAQGGKYWNVRACNNGPCLTTEKTNSL